MSEVRLSLTPEKRDVPGWWLVFFLHCGDWPEARRVLWSEYDAYVTTTEEGTAVSLVFRYEQDATLFLLKWS